MSKKSQRFATGVILIATCLATEVRAAPPKHLPAGSRQVSDAHWCFDLDSSRDLLIVDRNLTACLQDNALQTQKGLRAEQNVSDLTTALRLTTENVNALQGEVTHMTNLWKAENKKRHEAENMPDWGSWVGWGTAAVLAGVLSGVLLSR